MRQSICQCLLEHLLSLKEAVFDYVINVIDHHNFKIFFDIYYLNFNYFHWNRLGHYEIELR
jgi:hypothetical protein